MDIITERRLWIDNRNFPGRRGLRPEFVAGVKEFIDKARTTDDFRWHGKIRCPCLLCQCVDIQDLPNVEIHLYEKGFMPNYYVWVNHGEFRELRDQIRDLEMIHGSRRSPVVEPDLKKGGSLHTGGSVSSATHKMRLEKEQKRTFSVQEMHKIRHIKKDKQKGEIWVDTRSKETWEKASKAFEDHRSSQQSECGSSTPAPLTVEDETRIWLEVNGGVKKGSAYGLGTMYASEKANSCYLGSSAPAASSSANPEEMARMKEEIAELERQNEAIRKANEDHQTKMEEMMQQILARTEKRKKKKKRKGKSSSKSKRKSKRRHSSSSESIDESSSG